MLNNVLSDPVLVRYGVPQGSVLGLKAFVIVTRIVECIAEMYGVSAHLYEDDTQLYVSFDMNDPDDLAAEKSRLKKCIAHIAAWMMENKLKLNKDKTEVIVICHSRQRHKLQDFTVKVGDTEIVPATSARNLGVMFDQNISIVYQVTAICKATNFHFRNIWRIQRFLTKKSAETAIHTLVTSCLDNNNALLAGVLTLKSRDCRCYRRLQLT